jgi:hypothetical protein
MRNILLVIVFLCVVFLVLRSTRKKIVVDENHEYPRQGSVTVNDIPALVAELQDLAENGGYCALLIKNTARDDENEANLQLSIEEGKSGLNWLLHGTRNLEDEGAFRRLVAEFGLVPEQNDIDGVAYWRVVPEQRLAELAQFLLRQLYGLTDSGELVLYSCGFDCSYTRKDAPAIYIEP